ncbi:MAG: DUF3048 domain-containing protein [Chloroflexota bacterium]|jgi:hypothetical protein
MALGLAAVGGVALGVLAAVAAGPKPTTPVAATSSPSPSATASASPSGSGSASPSATPSPNPTPSPTATPTPAPALVPAPLTGRPVSPAVAKRHVVAVMIDDHPDARPQSGFNDASVVWQAPAEGGIPRYMLWFQDAVPPSVGPVRSARLYFLAWAAEWNAVYAHVGGSPQAMKLLREQGQGQLIYNADEFRWGGVYFHRTKDRFAPHNVYTSGKELYTLSRRLGAKSKTMKPAWRFAPDNHILLRPEGGTITTVYPWNTITYRYDRKSNTYRRSVSGEKRQTDRGRKEFVAPKNVIVMVMSFGALNDGSKKHRLEAQFIGRGPAWVSTNGMTVKGTWRKTSMKSPTRFFDARGNPITLTVGQTFIQVMPRGSKITIKDGKVPKPVPTLQQRRSERL